MIDFLIGLMSVDSTSGKENSAVEWLLQNYNPSGAEVEVQDIPNGFKNVYYKWGNPQIIFCSHFDTVPPYIPPGKKDGTVHGRGSCDAKGQLAVMSEVCNELFTSGETNFGLLMLAGEEVGSYGAKEANKKITGCKFVIVGEPTENKLIKASKGNILFTLDFRGKSCHSGYPQLGDNAIDRMKNFLDKLYELKFPEDEILGETTFNIGRLISGNAHNVVSDSVQMKIFFRTTFDSHDIIKNEVEKICDKRTELTVIYEDRPIKFKHINGFETGIVSFGSDAPELPYLGIPLLYGPGSIFNAHTLDEHIKISDMEKAKEDLLKMYYSLKEET